MEEGTPLGTVPRLLFATSAQNSLYEECTFGNAITDAMVKYTGADIAIINGGVLTGNLQHGDAYEKDPEHPERRLCPDCWLDVMSGKWYDYDDD